MLIKNQTYCTKAKTYVIDLLALSPDSKPNYKLIGLLRALKEQGNKLKLVSSQGCNSPFSEVYADEVMDWLNTYELAYLFDEIQIGLKPYAELYLDTKGIPPIAFELGIYTYQQWFDLCQSQSFKNLIKAYVQPNKVKYLTFAHNAMELS